MPATLFTSKPPTVISVGDFLEKTNHGILAGRPFWIP